MSAEPGLGYRRIIVAIDLDEPVPEALIRARQLVRRSRGEMIAVTAIPDLRALYRGRESGLHQRFDHDVVEFASGRLDRLCRQAGVGRVPTEILRGEPGHAVAQKLDEWSADLVVFGNPNPHGWNRYLGGFRMGLLHTTHCDLLAVSESDASRRYRVPLVAVNLDGHQDRLVQRARTFLPDVSLSLLHVVRSRWSDYQVDPVRFAFGNREQDIERTHALMHEMFDPLLTTYAPASLEFEAGIPSKRIHKRAREGGHDVVVINSGVHHGLGWHLGSTAGNILSAATYDVLVVRPDRGGS